VKLRRRSRRHRSDLHRGARLHGGKVRRLLEPDQGSIQTALMVQSRQGPMLGARVSIRKRVVRIPTYRNDLVPVQRHHHAARRQADPADSSLLSGHCDIMSRKSDWVAAYLPAWGGADPHAVVGFRTNDVEFEDVTAGHKNVGKDRAREPGVSARGRDLSAP
jgi:hypothetical protein